MPNDYTLVTSRIALITREARHPNAARLLLDFMLSRKGQEALTKAHMLPSREDVAVRAGRKPAGTIGRPVRLGAALLTNLDTMKRKRFIANWDHALAGGRSRR
jgi:iron(III) transport system substrate-binding protein